MWCADCCGKMILVAGRAWCPDCEGERVMGGKKDVIPISPTVDNYPLEGDY